MKNQTAPLHRIGKPFIYIYILAAFGICTYALITLDAAWESTGWESATGEILNSKTAPMGKSQKPEITYRFTVDGHTYINNRIMIGPGPMGGGIGILSPHQYVRKYPEGRSVNVYYAPDDPSHSVLEPGYNRIIILFLLTGIFFLLLGILTYRNIYAGAEGETDRFGRKMPGNSPKPRKMKKNGDLLVLLTLVSFFTVIGYAFYPKYRPLLEKTGIVEPDEDIRHTRNNGDSRTASGKRGAGAPKSELDQEDRRALSEQNARDRQAAARERAFAQRRAMAEEEARRKAREQESAHPVTVSIGEGFKPVDKGLLGAFRSSTERLSNEPPAGITREPAYAGDQQLYGVLEFSGGPYFFAFDQIDRPHPVLYFDKNDNGDLTDDDGPLENQGSGRFATEIRLPVARVIEQLDMDADFRILFFTNDRSWEKGYASHYSRTALKGTVSIGGRTYTACIAEVRLNDGDFTNDGIYIDFNGNGEIERSTEHVRHHQILHMDGTPYRFDIR
jgi:hypothetical protein